MSLESITSEIIELNEKIKQLEILREEELTKEDDWDLTKYPLEILDYQEKDDKLTVECNYESYFTAKNEGCKDVFYIETWEKYNSGVSLTLETAKQLSDYLLKVINYMEDK